MCQTRLRLMVVATSLALVVSCSSDGPTVGSESHFLQPCQTTADCTDGLACTCGICTLTCSGDATCSGVGLEQGTTSCGPLAELSAQCPDGESWTESICVADCTDDAQCRAINSSLRCTTGGWCKPDQWNLHDDIGLGEERDGEEENSEPCLEREETTCCDEQTEQIIFSDYTDYDDPQQIFWELRGPVSSEESFAATWLGVSDLEAPMEIACPPRATEMGLPCSIAHAIQLKLSDDTEVELLIGLDRQWLEEIPVQTEVMVHPRRTRNDLVFTGLRIDHAHDGGLLLNLLHMTSIQQPGGGRTVGQYQEFNVSLPPDEWWGDFDNDHLSEAHCVTRVRECGPPRGDTQILRADPLIIEADTEVRIAPGSIGSVTAGDHSFHFWHIISIRHYHFFEFGMCVDRGTANVYAVIRAPNQD